MSSIYFFCTQLVFWVAVSYLVIGLAGWLFLRAGKRGFIVALLWPMWLPLWCLVRLHHILAHPVSWLDVAMVSHWHLWARDFVVMAAGGNVDKTILTEDPSDRMLRLAAEQARGRMRERPPECEMGIKH